MGENVASGGQLIGLMEMEEEEELFEINLEAFNEIPPPEYFWGGLVVSTGEALLANCLLPVSDLLSAVPVNSNKSSEVAPVLSVSGVLVRESLPGKLQVLY